VAHLRSLYIPHIADHPHGANIDPQELACQIVDIVTLRPEIELCYMGIGTKCFEILETKATDDSSLYSSLSSSSNHNNGGYHSLGGGQQSDGDDQNDDEADDLDDDDDDIDVSDEDEDDSMSSITYDSADSDDDDDEDEYLSGNKKDSPRLRLQEILFYDKVSIFKARYGRL
jgi:hypothetical protein